MDILSKYLSIDGIVKEPSQLLIIQELSLLQSHLVALDKREIKFLNISFSKNEKWNNKGMYLWGDVGRGKTFLMDLFFETLDIKNKKRLHFHHLLDEIHEKLKERAHLENPIEDIVKSIAKEVKVMCFDEFYIEDITDAMILSKLLENIFKHNIYLVITSNSEPSELYKGGLQRELFLPAIDSIKKHLKVINISKGDDHRLRKNESSSYHTNSDIYHDSKLEKYFESINGSNYKKDECIIIRGRKIESRYYGDEIIWFDFLTICGDKRSKNDYIDIAKKYKTIIISNVIEMDLEMENEARRFIALVDELYDQNTNLILATNREYKNLYQGDKLKSEYERTNSRLIEMQDNDYKSELRNNNLK